MKTLTTALVAVVLPLLLAACGPDRDLVGGPTLHVENGFDFDGIVQLDPAGRWVLVPAHGSVTLAVEADLYPHIVMVDAWNGAVTCEFDGVVVPVDGSTLLLCVP